MKCWTILALFAAICAVFLGAGHAEETAKLDDFEKQPSEDAEIEEQLADSFMHRENDDGDDDGDETLSENALDNENKTPSDDEDQPSMFKRRPLWGRPRRSRRPRRRRDSLFPKIHSFLKNLCKTVSESSPQWVKTACGIIHIIGRDEEKAHVMKDKSVGPDNQADEVARESWLKEEGN